jgi:type I restriction enzyme, S subunit
MTDEWVQTTLGSIATKDGFGLVDGPFGSNLPASCYTESGIPVIRGSNLALGTSRFRSDEFVFVSRDTAERLARSLCRPLDIVFTKKGTLGQTGLVPQNGPYNLYLLSSNQMKLTVNRKLADPLFVYYFVSSTESTEKIIRDSEVTGVPKTNVTYLRDFPIALPSLPEQRAIAHILGTLDDKIELNRRMNETLEAMARALFKSWFVNFDPVRAKAEGRARQDGARSGQQRKPLNVASDLPWPGAEAGAEAEGDSGLPKHIADLFPNRFEDSELGEIPNGWKLCGLDEIARFLNGLALQKFLPENRRSLPVIKIAQLRAGSTAGADSASADLNSDYIVEDGDVLFSWSGSLECKLWCGGRGALNQHLFKVTSADFPKWYYYLWIHEHLASFRHTAAGKATTMGHIQRHHLSDAKVIVPDSEVLAAADKALSPLIEHIVQRQIESRTLGALRDTLLPKLISGELRALNTSIEAVRQ